MSPLSAGENAIGPLVEPAASLSSQELERYSRHILIPEIGIAGQLRLKNARVLVVGAGGLGSPALLYLAAAGVGTLGIIDDDVVDVTNLQRQIIHGMADIGRSKLVSARDAVAELNPLITVVLHETQLTAENALDLFADYDLIVDGTDNFATRYLVCDAAAILGKPSVWGSIFRFDGQVSVSWQKHGATYRDLYPEAPADDSAPSCGEGGVFGMICAAIGSVMVAETIKLITGVGRTLVGRVLFFDALNASWREVAVRRDPVATEITVLIDYANFCGISPAPDAARLPSIDVHELALLLDQRAAGMVEFDLIDVREPAEHTIVSIPGSRLVPQELIFSGEALGELALDRDIILHCKSGGRSATVLRELERRGYTRVIHLDGGVLDWVAKIDSSLAAY
ncbi:MAG: molybdopterin-synthase adenylyltransferase MoeB [Microbacteriaceae bacterium]|nr:molybdopterin-synthase adenylyltransferase MoeB [Microbacteriaceae bacterium]